MPKINAPTIDEHKALTRNALLEAGAQVFAREGLAGTSIGTLAETAGIARTTVYEYFPNKDSVLAALIDERLPPIVVQVVQDLPDAGPTDRLAEILRRAFEFVAIYPVEATLLFRVSRELPKAERDEAWSVFDPIRAEIAQLCRQGIDSGLFPGIDALSLGTIVADHLIGGINELLVRGDRDRVAVIEARISFLRWGLTSIG